MSSMEKGGVWSPVVGRDLLRELRTRNSPYIFQTISLSDREKYVSNGWEFDRNNKKSIRMKRPKPIGDALEDQIWSLMAKMGFEEMNHGRNFKIPTGGDEKQIDVFARDELSCLIISCKANTHFRGRSLQTELESLDHLDKRVRSEVRKHYSSTPPFFVGFVLATKNIEWSDEDERRAKNWGIRVIKDEEIDYYSKLTDLIGSAARYQLMADLFEGHSIPKMRGFH